MLLGEKARGKRTPAKPAAATSMWRASLILQKSREAMARKEIDTDETSQSQLTVAKSSTDTRTEQVTTSGWQRESSCVTQLSHKQPLVRVKKIANNTC